MQGGYQRPAEGTTAASKPSESRLFADALVGRSPAKATDGLPRPQATDELLEWVAAISKGPSRRTQATTGSGQVSGVFTPSGPPKGLTRRETLHERLQGFSRDYVQWLAEISADYALLLEPGEWDPAKHPRLGGPPNAGWFASTGGSSGGETPKVEPPSTAPAGPATKSHLPADGRGEWVSGTKGDGVFRYNFSEENQLRGVAGMEVRYEGGNIAVGGFEPSAYDGGNAAGASVEIDRVTGTSADARAADAAMRKKLNDPSWKRPEGYEWNHAGKPGSRVMELVRGGVHGRVSHKGPAAVPRAARRAGGSGGTAARAMGALTIYLAARDVAQRTGLMGPDYEEDEHLTYHYKAPDGSVFVVQPSGWLSSAKRIFVSGPRKGQSEDISDWQADEYRKQAEAEWGRYVGGAHPHFIPGRQRSSVPLIKYEDGIPSRVGWIDKEGVHYYAVPLPGKI